ncbi:hypothetical protein, partial [Xanthomonas oryzae]|uniref:hypothetical protein n=1 Tax=Xanthomonas oryzae TaxID=347 RepID=UPI003CCF234D
AKNPQQVPRLFALFESVDGAPALAAGQGIMLPGGSQNRQNVAKIAPDSAFFQSLKCKKLEF